MVSVIWANTNRLQGAVASHKCVKEGLWWLRRHLGGRDLDAEALKELPTRD